MALFASLTSSHFSVFKVLIFYFVFFFVVVFVLIESILLWKGVCARNSFLVAVYSSSKWISSVSPFRPIFFPSFPLSSLPPHPSSLSNAHTSALLFLFVLLVLGQLG